MTSNTRTGNTLTAETAGGAVNTAENGKTFARKRHPKAIGKSAFHSVPKHRAFIPMVTIWAGPFLALITAVLPDFAIAKAISLTGVFLPLLAARLILAFAIGLAGALLGFILASAIARRAERNDSQKNGAENGAKNGDRTNEDGSACETRDVEPIDPAEDLGSESLDAPIAQTAQIAQRPEPAVVVAQEEIEPSPEPQLGELARRGFDMDAPFDPSELTESDLRHKNARHKKGAWSFTRNLFKDAPLGSGKGADCEAASSQLAKESAGETTGELPPTEFAPLTADRITRAKRPMSEKPLSLDLHEFAALPARDGVWVKEPQEFAEPPSEQSVSGDLLIPHNNSKPASGLEKLRQTPASELSLVEMVERLAAALHDRQAEERVAIATGQVTREAALAEALKALSLFTQAGFDQGTRQATGEHTSDHQIHQTQDSLRSALARLQTLRGAA